MSTLVEDVLEPNHALVVTPSGLVEVLHSDLPIDIQTWLINRNAQDGYGLGEYVWLTLFPHDDEQGEVHFIASNATHENHRAREVLARLTNVHILLTGNVAFTGLSEGRTFGIIRDIG